MAEKTTNKQTSSIPSIRVKIDKLSPEGSKIKAFATVYIGNSFAIHGLRVVDGEKGLFVAMPSTSYQKNGKTEYQETFHPTSSESRKALNEAVLEAYKNNLEVEETENVAEEPDDDLPFSLNM